MILFNIDHLFEQLNGFKNCYLMPIILIDINHSFALS